MSSESSAGQHIRFVDPLPSPPPNRPRKLGIRYPSVAQRKDIPDRSTSPDLAWPGPRPLSRMNLSITPLMMPSECPPTDFPTGGSFEGYVMSSPELERTMEEIRLCVEAEAEMRKRELEKPRRTPSMGFSDSLRGLLNLARDSFMSLSPSPSKSSLDDRVERPRLFLHCNSSDGQDSSGSSTPSSTTCESSDSSGDSLTSTPACDNRPTWLQEELCARDYGDSHP